MKTIVYVDGFNLYYGSLRGAACPHKWLDLGKLFSLPLPGDRIVRIEYFTARVTPRPGNPGIAQRQQIHLRAWETVPGLDIYFGHFLKTRVRMAVVNPPPATQEVWKTEEKGSDVNLATHLVADGFRPIRQGALAASQFPATLRDATGAFRKPAAWAQERAKAARRRPRVPVTEVYRGDVPSIDRPSTAGA